MNVNNKKERKRIFFKSRSFVLGIVFLMVFASLLILPSIYFFQGGRFNADSIYIDHSIDKNKFLISYYKVGEISIWSTVCITSLIVIFCNTIYYMWAFKDELMNNHFKIKKTLFNAVALLFGAWTIFSVCYIVVFVQDYNHFNILLSKTNQYQSVTSLGKEISVDRLFVTDLSELFGEFIHDVEKYTTWTMTIFIAIDSLSLYIKYKQIKNTNEGSTIEEKLLVPQKSFVASQLYIVDIPVFIGLFLITFFVSSIPEDNINVFDSKFVFIAGGIGMHIIMSQITFLFLNMKYRYEEYKILY